MASRVDTILNRVLFVLGDPAGKKYFPTVVLSQMDIVQQDICQKGFALKGSDAITLEKGTDTYDLTGKIWRLKNLRVPKGWQPIEWVNNDNRWTDVKNGSYCHGTQPRFARVYDSRLQVHPAPLMTGAQLELEYWGEPTADLAEGGAPEFDKRWDQALEWGTIAGLRSVMVQSDANGGTAPETDYEAKYQAELTRQQLANQTENPGVIEREHWSDNLGF